MEWGSKGGMETQAKSGPGLCLVPNLFHPMMPPMLIHFPIQHLPQPTNQHHRAPAYTQVGPKTLVSWFAHYFALVAYSLGHVLLSPLRGVVPSYSFQRMLDALEYGSGSDYRYHAPAGPAAGAAVSAGRGAPVAAALSAAARSIDGGAATESMDGGDGGDAAGEAGAAGKSEGGSVKGRKAPKQQQPAAEPMPIPVPVAAATAAAAAMAAATMVVGLPGIGPVTLG